MEGLKKEPNILFLMTDQHRWDALGFLNPVVKTPNLDKLARTGIHFSQAICNVPMCMPSRYSMMTGLYPSQVGVRHNTQMCSKDEDLPVPVLAQQLKSLGYQTAGFGKTHWYIGSYDAPDLPVETSTRGFEVRAEARPNDLKSIENGAVVYQLDDPEAFAAVKSEKNGYGLGEESVPGYTGCTSNVPAERHREGWLTQKALEFLNNGRDGNRPFFLYISFDYPHAGLNVPKDYEDLYDIDDIPDTPLPPDGLKLSEHVKPWRYMEDWKKKSSLEQKRTILRYYALCSYIDDLFGRVIKKLDEIGELENTFIFFTADHGEMLWERYRYSKYCMYEPSVRVPMILSGVGIHSGLKGTTDDRYAELVDVLPTIMHMTGRRTPPELAGRSLLDKPFRVGGFSEMHGSGYQELQYAPVYMWRTKEWKLILHLPGKINDANMRLDEVQGELYNLTKDPYEYYNLYEDDNYHKIREKMTRDMLMHLAAVWARYPRQVALAKLE